MAKKNDHLGVMRSEGFCHICFHDLDIGVAPGSILSSISRLACAVNMGQGSTMIPMPLVSSAFQDP